MTRLTIVAALALLALVVAGGMRPGATSADQSVTAAETVQPGAAEAWPDDDDAEDRAEAAEERAEDASERAEDRAEDASERAEERAEAAAERVAPGAADRASAAALSATNGGTVTDVEAGDDGADGYEVEVTRGDGTEAEVGLDRSFNVVSVDEDD